ncbi:MAG: MarR family transcriptional regulator [SAR324 cluster bacterium]|uniref:MarR family transcriptional regulator n=1 Tax=SAR324 cluster bacterium TaxID=2024889 RepID=A0A2A4SV50_9DELT|nr:MAG: MarR family transcriptional regulator [SAR324 cluster bacterium]
MNVPIIDKLSEQENELLKLNNQLCFSIYSASKAVTKTYRPLLESLELTYPQYLVMLVLWENQAGRRVRMEISVKELGKSLYLDSGTLTPLLKRLESKKLIYRQRSAEDERVLFVSLTQEGIELKKRAVEIPKKLLCQVQLPFEKLRQLREDLKNLRNQFLE